MKKYWLKISAFVLAAALVVPASLMAQEEEKVKDKEVKERKKVEQIIITKKGEDKEKIVVEINGDKVTVNGKPIEEYKDKDGNISVRRSKDGEHDFFYNFSSPRGAWNLNNFDMVREDANRAMLGVTTEKAEGGVKINSITKESAAEKLGLKEGDIITKIDDKKIDDPDALSEAVRSHKPGDKVAVTYQRDKKEQKGTAELTKWKGVGAFSLVPDQNFKMDLGDLKFDQVMPREYTMPRMRADAFGWSGGGPKLGLSVQDTDEGKGVKVIEVDSESNAAKAGVKEDDVIIEVDGKAVNGTDDMVKMIRESKEKTSIMLKLQRAGKTQNIEVKMPKRIKTADL